VSLSINGYPCKSGIAQSQDGFPLQADDVEIMRGAEASGTIERLQMWQEALSDAEMLAKAGCTLPPTEKPCEAPVVFSPRADGFRASTIYSGSIGHYYYGHTLHPEDEPLHPKPHTRNPTPETLDPQP